MTKQAEQNTAKMDTILSHIGINQDEATGSLISPIHFSTTYQHPEFGKSTGLIIRVRKTQRAPIWKKLWQRLKLDSLRLRLVQAWQRLCWR